MSYCDPYFSSKLGKMYSFDPPFLTLVAFRVDGRWWASLPKTWPRGKSNFKQNNVQNIRHMFLGDEAQAWKALDKLSASSEMRNEPDTFANHFETLSKSPSACHFDKEYERQAPNFLDKYESGELDIIMKQSLESQIVNDNFTSHEINQAINSLKRNKSPGIDGIPAEFLKHCKDVLLGDIKYLFNYIIDHQYFPEIWAESLCTPVYKNGDQYQPGNYRGITALSIPEKGFELAVCNRRTFVNEAFKKIDETNGAYLKGRRTSDNLFVLNGLIEEVALHLLCRLLKSFWPDWQTHTIL